MPKKGSFLRELPVIVVSALIVSIVIKTFFLHFFFIPSGSMENTLQVGDRIAVNKFGALFSEIKRGEVAVFADPDNWLGSSPESIESTISGKIKSGLILVGVLPDPAKQYLIKRVIGVGGDNVICCDATGKLQVNGVSVTEPYIFKGDKPSDMQFNVDIPKGFVWVMGDHRGASADSRFHPDSANNGMVPLSKVVGRATFIVWPISNIALIPTGEDLKRFQSKISPRAKMIELTLLKAGIKNIAGVDEAGRGPCAGPLVVACVILKDPLSTELNDVKDSKELSAQERDELYKVVIDNSLAYSIIEVTVSEIDSLGLHKCNIEGMRRAINALTIKPEYVLTDGYPIPGLTTPNLAVWKGDQVAISISAASILAKVYRDKIMVELDREYPNYGLASHKGYITASHTAAIKEWGVLPIHRKSFANIAAVIEASK